MAGSSTDEFACIFGQLDLVWQNRAMIPESKKPRSFGD